MKKLVYVALAIPMLAQAATASELIGSWVHIKYQSMRVEIADNGSSYVISALANDMLKKYPARFADGILIANTGPCSMSVDIEKKTGHLLYLGQEYRRAKSGESLQLPK